MKTMAIAGLAVLTATAATTLPTSPVSAGACSDNAITARGEQSKFIWLAKTKARANWRRKVRATPGLGDGYANWARAQNTEERCLTGPAGTICIFTGTPCLP
jgi:hypothetical protein